jgi:hypothetical protein
MFAPEEPIDGTEIPMVRTSTILLATALTMSAIPAFAAWERMGSLNVAAGQTEQFDMEDFKGNVIGLTAPETDVSCDRVTATFADGHTRPIFKGKLPKGLSVRVDLPPGAVERIDLECHPVTFRQGTIDLAADSGAPKPRRRG